MALVYPFLRHAVVQGVVDDEKKNVGVFRYVLCNLKQFLTVVDTWEINDGDSVQYLKDVQHR